MTARSLVLAAALAFLAGCTAAATPAPSPPPSIASAGSPAPSPATSLLTGSPSPATSAPATTVSTDVPPVQVPIGAVAVTVTEAVRVRSAPWVADDSIKYEPVLPVGTYLHVLEGPVAGSGYWWYRIVLEEDGMLEDGVREGWVASANHDGTPWIDWLVDTDPGSPLPSGTADCPVEVTPSALVALDPETRIACYGSTTLRLAAVILPGDVEIDEVPVQVPARFEQVDDPKYGRLFLVDLGMDFDFETSLPLYVADPSMHLPVFFRGSDVAPGPPSPWLGGAGITGHFDDPASTQCRRPAGNDWPDITDAQAILWCRGRFIVTAVETGG